MLFVSKKVNDSSLLDFIKSKGVPLFDIPMISFSKVSFQLPKENFEVIFFTSPRSVQYFLEQCSIPEGVAIATIGESTTQCLLTKGYSVHFTGEASGEPETVSQALKKFVNGRKVLFPQSNYSHRSMQKSLDQNQILDLVVYETVYSPVQLQEKPKILVFTSPSNLISFLKVNDIDSQQKIIAWGKTTAAAIKNNGLQVDFTMKYSSFNELTKLLTTLI